MVRGIDLWIVGQGDMKSSHNPLLSFGKRVPCRLRAYIDQGRAGGLHHRGGEGEVSLCKGLPLIIRSVGPTGYTLLQGRNALFVPKSLSYYIYGSFFQVGSFSCPGNNNRSFDICSGGPRYYYVGATVLVRFKIFDFLT